MKASHIGIQVVGGGGGPDRQANNLSMKKIFKFLQLFSLYSLGAARQTNGRTDAWMAATT